MAAKIVPVCSGIAIPWTTPPIISGFLATNWAGAVLQLLLIIMGVFIYLPFIKVIDKQYMKEEIEANNQKEEDSIDLDNISFDDL